MMLEGDYHEGDNSARRAGRPACIKVQSAEREAVFQIRCDKDSPCANCRTANRPCSSTGAGQRPREARQRVLISTQYERKIDHFESRLANIENMLRDLAVSITSRSPSASATESGSAGLGPVPLGSSPTAGGGSGTNDIVYGREHDDDAISTFEGDSSISAQTVFASEFLENTVTRTLPRDLDPDMRSALSSLQQIVSMQNRPGAHESRFVNAKPLPKGGLHGKLASFATICTFIAAENFAERCSRVYFATDDFSLMSWGVVNAGLYFLLQEKAALVSGAQRDELLEYQSLCRDNLETALTNLPLLMPARKECIEAFYAIEISKFSIARDLNTVAANLCQTLGYHRLHGGLDTTPRAVLFWSAYLLDKALSVRSGRAPTIQDYDITLPRSLEYGDDLPDASWAIVLTQWIAYADFLGRAYEQLYSPAALARPQERRAESARQLVRTMNKLAKEQEPLVQKTREKVRGIKFDANSPFPMDMAIVGDELMHWSALTLVYRAIPSPPGSPSTFNPECIHAARQAFACHQEYMSMAGDSVAVKAGCIRWNVIYVPFTPVIVLFCHIIETSDMVDLQRVADFVESLVPVCAASEAVAKLHRICKVLHNVASLCVRAKAQRRQDPQQRDQDMTMVGNNIDMYLSQLGFMPQFAGAHPMQQPPDAQFVGPGPMQPPPPGPPGPGFGPGHPAQANELGNWFSGNTHILGLLEEDLSGFEPQLWPAMGGQ
ncbi:hypothetical protein CHGG_06711 [Chaetomium globosum CBS 148.51]|uniref:Xylanolytic transcriptional activator regulatory domain-containing protein n=1 Tax=Chaetomium globosum (strain ATCC 6205 / CBS 148.51 / DSM 1962 / NBRC 6347 / NRRL 1970) TaxID=306901 RepID=Q2H3Q4_CHAGB|nr:uncharacterized protein CHGG_06711 [Chaetomium globosum CBS 148.51]EAQ90092.1 hypothetical protein CHGG_06711 [Chaetomium globosum CBS 148.51]